MDSADPAAAPTRVTVGDAVTRKRRLDRLATSYLYVCTGVRPAFPAFLDQILAGGVDLVQLREKGLEWSAEAAQLTQVAAATATHDALSSANDRADLAAPVGDWPGTDVLHVGQDDLPPRLARELVGPDVLIGLSTHGPAQLAAAARNPDVDYFCVGPVWATPTKAGRPGVGLDLLRLAVELAPPGSPGAKPWFVTGGVDGATLDDVLATGARRVVVVRGITQAPDPGEAAAALATRLRAAAPAPA